MEDVLTVDTMDCCDDVLFCLGAVLHAQCVDILMKKLQLQTASVCTLVPAWRVEELTCILYNVMWTLADPCVHMEAPSLIPACGFKQPGTCSR